MEKPTAHKPNAQAIARAKSRTLTNATVGTI